MVFSYQIYVLKISSTELILYEASGQTLWAKFEPKHKYKWLPAKRSEGAEGVLAEPREDPSICIIVNYA